MYIISVHAYHNTEQRVHIFYMQKNKISNKNDNNNVKDWY